MISWIKNLNLKAKQKIIQQRFPGLAIFLHKDMPMSSVNEMVRLASLVWQVNSYEEKMKELSDKQLREKTEFFRQQILKNNQLLQPEIEKLEQLLESVSIPEEKERIKEKIKQTRLKVFDTVMLEAFAVVREAAKRTIGLRHFDVQVAGAIVLHEGKIAEMATGEGKTLVATMPAYLNALLGKGVHIVTVNDYLARRDREWMGPIYEFLGLSVGCIQHDMSDEQRRQAYICDITYGTNNEFGFDYLRDNMKYSLEELVQRDFYYAIVDEVDSILIDEARTPLIISGASEESTDKYYTACRIAQQLKGRRVSESDQIDAKYKGVDLAKGFDYTADEKAHTISLTEEGEIRVAKLWGVDNLHSIETMEYKHHIIQALRAKEFFKRDREYIVKDGQVIIVDEFTGRLMPGRRWSDGLHQAIEAKEGLRIERENQTLATITFQNYFRMYEKLAGMTGTAYTEANEFKAIYKLDVVSLPTNRPLIRTNYPDVVYKTEKEKFEAVVNEIIELYQKGRPVLVGTIAIDKSEMLSDMLRRRGIPHQVLNAKFHEMEAAIVAQAGRLKTVTIATNMAGRGTDILLGGNAEFMAKSIIKQRLQAKEKVTAEDYQKLLQQCKRETDREHQEVVRLGGLHVIGTERHESRRIDNQLRGRCGRQGDPGSSRFYVSFDDDLMRLFAPEFMLKMLAGIETNGEPLTLKEGFLANQITRSIETAQRRVEQHNFEIRKQLLEYDNVMNKQREIIYNQRRQILEGISLKEQLYNILEEAVQKLVDSYYRDNAGISESGSDTELLTQLHLKFGLKLETKELEGKSASAIKEMIIELLKHQYEEKEQAVGSELMRSLERMVFLQIVDSKWKDHLYSMDKLREGIGLRAYGHRDPLIEYKNEAFQYFSQMIVSIKEEALETLLKLQPSRPERFRGIFNAPHIELHPELEKPSLEQVQQASSVPSQVSSPSVPLQSHHPKVGRNDPCPCGSGKKYKKCCGQ